MRAVINSEVNYRGNQRDLEYEDIPTSVFISAVKFIIISDFHTKVGDFNIRVEQAKLSQLTVSILSPITITITITITIIIIITIISGNGKQRGRCGCLH